MNDLDFREHNTFFHKAVFMALRLVPIQPMRFSVMKQEEVLAGNLSHDFGLGIFRLR
ncbi:MAG: hypothetical protein V1792_14970 [Pseudomonadota bacterium]